jgi:hypothetical protein
VGQLSQFRKLVLLAGNDLDRNGSARSAGFAATTTPATTPAGAALAATALVLALLGLATTTAFLGRRCSGVRRGRLLVEDLARDGGGSLIRAPISLPTGATATTPAATTAPTATAATLTLLG